MVTVATYQRETFEDTIEEAKPLLLKHWDELARNKEIIPLDPAYDKYQEVEVSGALRVYTVRIGGALAGYAVYLVMPHLHYKTTKWAVSDIIWVDPSVRKGMLGIGLLKFVENELRSEGVAVMHTTGKQDHPALGRILEHIGHSHIEYGYAKVLTGD